VLDYKIKELKKQIEPREKEIMGMTQQIKEMDDELEQYHKQTTNMDLNIQDLKLKLKAVEKEKSKEHEKVEEYMAYVKRFRRDLYNTIQLIQNPHELKDSLKKMYQFYCKEVNRKNDLDQDIQAEYNRQREHLERTVSTLKVKLSRDDRLHKTDNVRIMQENVALISEINQLRKEIKGIKQREKALELSNIGTIISGTLIRMVSL
jgi:chromosome segregation ATPase